MTAVSTRAVLHVCMRDDNLRCALAVPSGFGNLFRYVTLAGSHHSAVFASKSDVSICSGDA